MKILTFVVVLVIKTSFVWQEKDFCNDTHLAANKNIHCSWYLIHRHLFFKWAISGLFFFIFVFSIQLTVNIVQYNFLPMTGFKLRTSGIESKCSTNCATTTAQFQDILLMVLLPGSCKPYRHEYENILLYIIKPYSHTNGLWTLTNANSMQVQKILSLVMTFFRLKTSLFPPIVGYLECEDIHLVPIGTILQHQYLSKELAISLSEYMVGPGSKHVYVYIISHVYIISQGIPMLKLTRSYPGIINGLAHRLFSFCFT